MLRLALKLLLAAAAVAAIWAFVPFGGRTLGDRWKASRGPADFVERTWADMKGTPAPTAPPSKPHPPARPPRSQARAAQPPHDRAPAQPAETHGDADRRAIDQLVSDRI